MYLNNFLSQNQNNRWGFFCILLYGLLVGFQGFDLCDEGWTMTAYQQIFICPQSVEYNFLYYVTLLVGGLWEKLFGWGGYLSFRLLQDIRSPTENVLPHLPQDSDNIFSENDF